MKKAVLLCGLLLGGAVSADITVEIDYAERTISVDGGDPCHFHEISGTLTSNQRQELRIFLCAEIDKLVGEVCDAVSNDQEEELVDKNNKATKLRGIVERLG